MASELVFSPWRLQFKRLISSTQDELRIVAPFYSEEAVHFILTKARRKVSKYFIFALSERAVKSGVQSIPAIKKIQNDTSSEVKFIKIYTPNSSLLIKILRL
jgi:hypothetical protein